MAYAHLFGLTWALASLLIVERIFPQPSTSIDNLEVFQTLFDKAADHITSRTEARRESPLFIAPVADHASAEAFLRGEIIESALRKDRIVYGVDSLSGVQNYFQIVSTFSKCFVEYSQIRRSWLWRKGTARRQASIELDFELIEKPSGRILLRDTFKTEFADTVRTSSVKDLESPQIRFTIGRAHRQSAWSRMMEPLLLAAATGGVIYALYALRSQ